MISVRISKQTFVMPTDKIWHGEETKSLFL